MIARFTDLDVWKEGHSLVLMVYTLTKLFPKDELFALTSQMRRCAVSITSNVAEGFSRQSIKEKIQFYCISLGSITELQDQIIIARDIGYLSLQKYLEIEDQLTKTHKILCGLIRSTKKRLA